MIASMTERVINLVFLVLPDTLLLDLAGPAEAFRLANQALRRRGRPEAFRLRYVGPQAETVSSVGLTMARLEPLPEQLDPDTWVMVLGRPGETTTVLAPEPAWLTARDWLARVLGPLLDAGSPSDSTQTTSPPLPARAGRHAIPPWRLVTVCVGALLAADAGLLAGRRVTTHHELLDDLTRLAPTARVVPNRVFVQDGPLLSSAGITAGIDLALHAVAEVCGDALAAAVAQVMVVFTRRQADQPERSPLLAGRDHLHPALHRVQDAVAEHPERAWSLTALAEAAHVTPRHLTRLFQTHCDCTPRDHVERVRLALADQALQRGQPREAAARTAGFTSARQWRAAQARLQRQQNVEPTGPLRSTTGPIESA